MLGPMEDRISRYFNPHLPRGRRRRVSLHYRGGADISTHTSLAGGDGGDSMFVPPYGDFNPHLPRGRRQESPVAHHASLTFQPTPPSREATEKNMISNCGHDISTHTSLAGGDSDVDSWGTYAEISTHTSLAGGDKPDAKQTMPNDDFNPHLPRGRRLSGIHGFQKV